MFLNCACAYAIAMHHYLPSHHWDVLSNFFMITSHIYTYKKNKKRYFSSLLIIMTIITLIYNYILWPFLSMVIICCCSIIYRGNKCLWVCVSVKKCLKIDDNFFLFFVFKFIWIIIQKRIDGVNWIFCLPVLVFFFKCMELLIEWMKRLDWLFFYSFYTLLTLLDF